MSEDYSLPSSGQSAGGDSFRRLLDKLPAAAYMCDSAGLITYFNRHAVELWGREPKLNDPADRFCGSFRLFAADGTPIDHDRCWMARALMENKEFNGHEIVIERPDGTRATALAHANPICDDAGVLQGAVNVLVDITQRKQAEDALREADRRKTEFIAMLAHELRNPLAPLRSGLQVLRMADNQTAATRQAQAMMERQVAHLVRVVDDLLDASRITQGKLVLRRERLNLADAVRDAVDTIRPIIDALGHELCVSLPSQSVYVDGDRTRLAQALSNLLNNSTRYADGQAHIWLFVERDGDEVVITVRDDGVGIPSDVLPEVFDMFTQADRSLERAKGGLGVGLSLVRGIVELHGGRAEAHSDGPGTGTQVRLHLPLAPAPPVEATADDGGDHRAPAGGQLKVLVVDDNRDAAVTLAMILRIMGHETKTAYDGLEAVEVAAEFQPDVVLLDLGLPRLNGLDACRRMRAAPAGQHMTIIALSGWGQDDDKRRTKEAGFDFHMVKPVDPPALEKLLAGISMAPA